MWEAIAGQAGLAALGNVLSGNRQITAINNRLARTRAESANRVAAASNVATAAQGSLSRWNQSLDNRRRLEAGGKALEANTVNSLRQADAGTYSSFSADIQSHEQAGAAAATQAFAGVDGSVVDIVNMSTNLRDAVVRQRTSDVKDMASWDAAQRSAGILQQMASSLDSTILLEGLNTVREVALQQRAQTVGESALQGALKGAIQAGAAGVADFSLDKIPGVGQWFKATVPKVSDYSLTTQGARFGFKLPKDNSPYSLL